MIPPIPKKLLPHSAELVTKFDPDKWGNSSESEAVILEHIRIEPSEKMITDDSGTQIRLSATLFFDQRNSSPASGFSLKGDVIGGRTVDIQQIIFGGRTFTVKAIEAHYADGKNIHHYEIGLV